MQGHQRNSKNKNNIVHLSSNMVVMMYCYIGCDDKVTTNSMFARLGTDYEIRNQWFFAILEAMTTD